MFTKIHFILKTELSAVPVCILFGGTPCISGSLCRHMVDLHFSIPLKNGLGLVICQWRVNKMACLTSYRSFKRLHNLPCSVPSVAVLATFRTVTAPSVWVPAGSEAEQSPQPTSNRANELCCFKPLRSGGCMLGQYNSSYLHMYKYECLNIHNCLPHLLI